MAVQQGGRPRLGVRTSAQEPAVPLCILVALGVVKVHMGHVLLEAVGNLAAGTGGGGRRDPDCPGGGLHELQQADLGAHDLGRGHEERLRLGSTGGCARSGRRPRRRSLVVVCAPRGVELAELRQQGIEVARPEGGGLQPGREPRAGGSLLLFPAPPHDLRQACVAQTHEVVELNDGLREILEGPKVFGNVLPHLLLQLRAEHLPLHLDEVVDPVKLALQATHGSVRILGLHNGLQLIVVEKEGCKLWLGLAQPREILGEPHRGRRADRG
mmetsp:Transcript_36652/g.116658  ORF Transcript_36652/g.116658 Transcript_36652/m.116658 type:complete len:270 (+) Transcript_36652:1239-2048(+)